MPDVSFSLWGRQNWAARPQRRVSKRREKYYEPTKWPAPRWLDSSVGGALYRYRKGQNIAPSKFYFRGSSLKVLHKACDTPLRDVQTIHVSNMSARDSVILLVSATNMVKIYLFTSSLVHFRRIEPKTAWNCEDSRCFCKSHPGAVQISLSSSANTVERKI